MFLFIEFIYIYIKVKELMIEICLGFSKMLIVFILLF